MVGTYQSATQTPLRWRLRRAVVHACQLLSLIAPLLGMQPATAADLPLSLVTRVASDWVYHGLSETDGNPVVGVNAEWQITQRFYAGLEWHDSEPRSARQRHRSLQWYAGVAAPLTENWHTSLTLKRREFPGSFKAWQYNEIDWRLTHRSGVQLHVDYAPDYYTHDTAALATQAAWLRDLGDYRGINWYAGLGSGYLALADSTDHCFGHVNVGATVSLLNVDLKYHWHNREGEPRFGEVLQKPGWVMQVSYQIR